MIRMIMDHLVEVVGYIICSNVIVVWNQRQWEMERERETN